MSHDRQYCTFFVDGLHFGVPVLGVQEVLRYQPMTPVPRAPAIVRGLINLRGQIVTAVDLRMRLDMPPSQSKKPPMNVVLRTPEDTVSLLVDEIGDVIDATEDTYEATPRTLDPTTREVIEGVYKLENGLLLVLDTENVLANVPHA